jgi:Zn finger protein HypA/HybF involved in hydrogenase expression
MKRGISGLFSDTIKTWAKLASEVFPPQIHCGFCMQALAEFDGTNRFCPHCKFPLF